MDPGLWPLILLAAAIFLLPAVMTGIRLQRVPFMMVEYVGIVLLFLLIGAMRNGGHSTLERVNLCATPSNLAGCPGYSAPVIDPAHDIPETSVPDYRPTPTWAVNPGR